MNANLRKFKEHPGALFNTFFQVTETIAPMQIARVMFSAEIASENRTRFSTQYFFIRSFMIILNFVSLSAEIQTKKPGRFLNMLNRGEKQNY